MSSDDTTRIALVRHGESHATVDRVVGGHAGCTGLTDRGRKQAEALADRLERTGELAGATALYSSVLPRAVETAAILTRALGDLETVQDCTFCEQHPGEADGITWDEYMTR
jgi:probable phosphoglycerate mutase